MLVSVVLYNSKACNIVVLQSLKEHCGGDYVNINASNTRKQENKAKKLRESLTELEKCFLDSH